MCRLAEIDLEIKYRSRIRYFDEKKNLSKRII